MHAYIYALIANYRCHDPCASPADKALRREWVPCGRRVFVGTCYSV